MNFLLDENVPISIKDVIHDLGFDVFTLHDFNMLGIQNGEVAKLALKEISTRDIVRMICLLNNLRQIEIITPAELL